MIKRELEATVLQMAAHFKAVAIIGPRQSGKTTLARKLFASKPYVSLENPDIRNFANDDPRGFLAQYGKGAIFDEIQLVPELFSYLQQILDESKEKGKFILTGSNNFLLQENISQSLAGRIAYMQLLPFSVSELKGANQLPDDLNKALFQGGYPPIYDQQIPPFHWFPQYVQTYIERDVRQLRQIGDLALFERFTRLCAGRIGQLLNKNSLAVETGVDSKTIDSWLGILEKSFIIKLLRPYYKNFNKRLVKMPKLYFIDVGLVCSLLGIRNAGELTYHPLRGSIFENFAWSELYKAQSNKGLQNRLFFWRDNVGHEIDIIIEEGIHGFPVEIKSGATIAKSFFDGIKYWRKLTGKQPGFIVYGGQQYQHRSDDTQIIPWHDVGQIEKYIGSYASGQ